MNLQLKFGYCIITQTKYCTLFVSGTELRTDRRTDRQTNGQTDGRSDYQMPPVDLSGRGHKKRSISALKQGHSDIETVKWNAIKACNSQNRETLQRLTERHVLTFPWKLSCTHLSGDEVRCSTSSLYGFGKYCDILTFLWKLSCTHQSGDEVQCSTSSLLL